MPLLGTTLSDLLVCIIPHRIAHTMTFVTQVVGHWLEREIAQWVHREEYFIDSFSV